MSFIASGTWACFVSNVALDLALALRFAAAGLWVCEERRKACAELGCVRSLVACWACGVGLFARKESFSWVCVVWGLFGVAEVEVCEGDWKGREVLGLFETWDIFLSPLFRCVFLFKAGLWFSGFFGKGEAKRIFRL